MENVKKAMTTTKMRHKTVALLLLIIIAFSNASCNFVGELEITENDASQVIGSTENKAEDKTENETEKATEIKNWHGAVEYDENMAKEIQNEYYSQIVPEEITRDPSKYEVQFIAKFADKYVVYIYDIHRDKGRMSAIDIGGFEFRYWRQNEIYVYESGVFTTLPEALEKKELSNDDLAATNAHFRRLNARRYKEIPTLLENERICTEYIAVGIQPSYNDKTYTVSDFPELKGVTEINQANGVKQPGDIAVSLHIMVENYSEQDIIDALWKLYERDDVLYARAGYYGTVD